MKDYIGLSQCYEEVYKQVLIKKEYIKALKLKICAIYLKYYKQLKEKNIWDEEKCYIESILDYSNELEDLLQKSNIHISNFEEKYDFMINQIPKIIEEYAFFLSDFDTMNVYRTNLNKYLKHS